MGSKFSDVMDNVGERIPGESLFCKQRKATDKIENPEKIAEFVLGWFYERKFIFNGYK